MGERARSRWGTAARAARVSAWAIAGLTILSQPCVGAVDLTGRWLFEFAGDPTGEKVDITQTGNTLTFEQFSGSVMDGDPFATWQAVYSNIIGDLIVYSGRVMPSGNLIDASIAFILNGRPNHCYSMPSFRPVRRAAVSRAGRRSAAAASSTARKARSPKASPRPR